MLETRSICYIDPDKTGCTHLANILQEILIERIHYFQHHPPINSVHLDSIRNKICFATLRNPWDWYLSQWRYGCTSRKKGVVLGAIYMQVFKSQQLRREFYSDDINDIETFQKWFWKLLEIYTKYMGQDIYIRDKIGPYSSWIYLQRKYPKEVLQIISKNRSVYSDILALDDAFEYIKGHIRTHKLEVDLIDFIRLYCRDFVCENYEEIIWEMKKSPSNQSIAFSRKERRTYTDFFSDDMKNTVEFWERLIFDKKEFTFSSEEDLGFKN